MPLFLVEDDPAPWGALAATRATFELRAGLWSPLERALLQSRDLILRCRPEIADHVRARTGLPVEGDFEAGAGSGDIAGLPASTPWEVLGRVGELLAADFESWIDLAGENFAPLALATGAHLLGAGRDLWCGRETWVGPGCVLDVRDGPIVLDRGARVQFSQLQGPLFVGAGSVVDGARLRPGTSIGPGCKIGGEVAASIFQARSNKAHEGFVGHSWVGEWVNFGALSVTSNLKNSYGAVRLALDLERRVDTGALFLGSIVGDHVKIGIAQGLTTGSHLGVGANVFGGAVAPAYVPPFCWGGPLGGWSEHRFEAFTATMAAVLARRGLEPSSAELNLLRRLFDLSAPERAAWLRDQA